MHDTEVTSDSRGGEYTVPETRDKPAGRNGSVAPSHRRMRLFYFGVASTWGFLCGVVGLAVVLSERGNAVGIDKLAVLLLLVPALAVALVGGVLASAAYRESRRRTR